MHDCPHCGEPVENDSESCPHCGSDFETGWNPEADYYSLELPEDDEAPAPEDSTPHAREISVENIVGLVLVLASGLLFFWVTRKSQGVPTALAAGLLLLLSIGLFHRWLKNGLKLKL